MLSSVLCACSKGGSFLKQNSIVGRWENEDEIEYSSFPDEYEFFSDGTYDTERASWCGTYSIDDDRIKIKGVLNTVVYTFEIEDGGNTLILTNDAGFSAEYGRID